VACSYAEGRQTTHRRKLWGRRTEHPVLFWAGLLGAVLALSHCGGGGGGGSAPPPSPDFTLSAAPSSLSLAPGTSTSTTVSVTGENGFDSQVNVTISGMPSGVTASPATFNLASGSQQAVKITAGGSAAAASLALTAAGTSGTLSHAAQVSLTITAAQDFSLTIQPSSATVWAGSSTTTAVALTGLNGFTGSANVAVGGMPAGVGVSPASFSLAAGGSQTLTISAAATASPGDVSLTLTATSGTLSHSSQVALSITYTSTSAPPPFRTRYVRTDAQWSLSTGWGNQNVGFYEPGTKRFFISDPSLNRVDVFDAASEMRIGEIVIPGAYGGDVSLDGKTIYIGTEFGDIYEIDPVGMVVTKRIPAVQIGPNGFPTFSVRVLADGKLALLGVGEYPDYALWNPADNSLVDFQRDTHVCSMLGNPWQLLLSADKTKMIIVAAPDSTNVCVLDPNTLQYTGAPLGGTVLIPQDGKEILSARDYGGTLTVTVYDSQDLSQTGQSQIATPGVGTIEFVLSYDGKTLYGTDGDYGPTLACDWKTGKITGWLTSFALQPMATEPSGLLVGATGEGVGFLDGTVFQTMEPEFGKFGSAKAVQPATGPVQGETETLISAPPSVNSGKVYYGGQEGTSVSQSSQSWAALAPAAYNPGPVDVAVATTDGSLYMAPEGFSYGPSV
jgi:hypothetical protein